MSDEHKCAVYARFATKAQADDKTARKLKAVRMLQKIGYKLAVAPVVFDGENDGLTILPTLEEWTSSDQKLDQIWQIMCKDVTLVIAGMEANHA